MEYQIEFQIMVTWLHSCLTKEMALLVITAHYVQVQFLRKQLSAMERCRVWRLMQISLQLAITTTVAFQDMIHGAM